MDSLSRLQNLLRELFQLDLADLDFGLYRLLHLRRREVEAFLTEQLPRASDEAFRSLSDQDAAAVKRDLDRLAEQIRDTIADDAIAPSGEIRPEHANTKLGKQYQALRHKLAAAEATEEQRREVFNHLYNFFSRYYDYEDGDFVPRRRYGAREAYAAPYNGEEVFFHWANRDQHYVKTAETCRDYAFTVSSGDLTGAKSYRVRFHLTAATVTKDNTKGDTRYFFQATDKAEFDAVAKALTISFEYRLPTEGELQRYG